MTGRDVPRSRGTRRSSRGKLALAPMIPRQVADSARIDERFLLSPLADGWRCLALIDDRIRLRARGGRDLSCELGAIAGELGRARLRAARRRLDYTVLDGVLELSAAARAGDEPLRIGSATRLTVLDALWLDGRDLTGLDIKRRLAALAALDVAPCHDRVEIAPAEHGPAAAYLEQFVAAGSLGLLARRAGSRYRPGASSAEWLVVLTRPTREFLLCGIASAGALVLGMPTPNGIAFGGVTWPTRAWTDLALRCEPGPPPFPPPPIWGSLGRVAWSAPTLWIAVTPEVRDGSGKGGPRWRFIRVQEDLAPPPATGSLQAPIQPGGHLG